MDDSELIKLCLEGDNNSFNTLIERYLPQVYGLALRLSKSPKEAEDIAQETFIKSWRKIKSFDQSKNFKPWLLTIARNTATDFLKKKKTLNFSDFENEEEDNFAETIEDATPLPDQIFEDKEAAAKLQVALEKIPPHYKEALLLHYREEMTFEEIGGVFKKPPNTVKSWHRRAILALRKHLSPKDPHQD